MPLHLTNSDVECARRRSLTRRSFLGLCVAGCSQLHRTTAPVRTEQRWALLADPHIGPDPAASVRGSVMAENLRTAVADVMAHHPDHVLVNGDMAYATGEVADYDEFARLIGLLRQSGVPLHLTLGNHDDRDNASRAFGLPTNAGVANKRVSALHTGGVRWMLLDSLEQVNAVRGSLGAAQLRWLADRLDEAPTESAIVCVHHNPELSWVGLNDSAEFLRTVLPRRQVKAVLFAHTHEYRVWRNMDLHFVNLPAIGYRFRPDVSMGWLMARVTPNGMEIQFRGISGDEPEHGEKRFMPWRMSLAPSQGQTSVTTQEANPLTSAAVTSPSAVKSPLSMLQPG